MKSILGNVAGSASLHPYFVQNASVGGTPRITITPGTHNGVTPTIYGYPMNILIGSPPNYPILTLGGDDTLVYFQINYDTNGNVLSVEIVSGNSVPTATITPGSSGSDYKLLSTLAIRYSNGVATVLPNNDGVSGPQGYGQCNTTSNVWLV